MPKKTATAKRASTKAPKKVTASNGGFDGLGLNSGAGGETHQTADDGKVETLTTQQGIPVADDQSTLRQGARGPALIEDFHFREKIFHFDHERIPERVVHARGYGLTDSLN
jgi:catalase